jgi:hypothetical protein
MSVESPAQLLANSQDAIAEAVQAHKAMAILRLLDGDVLRGSANDHIMAVALDLLGLRTSRAEMRQLIELLEKEGAIRSSSADELLVFQLKHHGRELAQGLAFTDRIERPPLKGP